MRKEKKQVKNSKKRSRAGMIWYRFRKNKLALIGLIVLIVMAILALIAPLIVSYEKATKQNASLRMKPPSAEHIFGTDPYGRDVFARIIWGARTSLSVGIETVFFSLLMGGTIGAVAGYFGGKVDDILMRFMDILLAIPSLVLALSIVAALGTSLTNLMLALAIARTPQFARVVRASVMPLRDMEYVEAARACGTSTARILLKHIIPNAFGPIVVQTTIQIGNAILNISSLSFVGLGIQPPAPEWGSMLSDVKDYMRQEPLQVLAPGIAIILTVFAFNRIGDGLRDALDPRLKN
ncbi:MAG: ABC transporter permease [Clostridia bacterium]|nr:ABC transporter permease [Clostridia bacterium]